MFVQFPGGESLANKISTPFYTSTSRPLVRTLLIFCCGSTEHRRSSVISKVRATKPPAGYKTTHKDKILAAFYKMGIMSQFRTFVGQCLSSFSLATSCSPSFHTRSRIHSAASASTIFANFSCDKNSCPDASHPGTTTSLISNPF